MGWNSWRLHRALKLLQIEVQVKGVVKPVWVAVYIKSEARVIRVVCSGGMGHLDNGEYIMNAREKLSIV